MSILLLGVYHYSAQCAMSDYATVFATLLCVVSMFWFIIFSKTASNVLNVAQATDIKQSCGVGENKLLLALCVNISKTVRDTTKVTTND